jgi:signal transduction histidine kinase
MLIKKLELPSKIELEQFISVQAHDLRSPFNQVIGFGKLLINSVDEEPLSALQKDDLNTVYRSSMRALNLMNALIDIARLNRGEKASLPGRTNIELLTEHSLNQWKKYHPGNETQIQYHILTPSPDVYLDEQLMQQVINGAITYVTLFCESKATVHMTLEEEPGGCIFTFISQGTKAHAVPEMDLEMLGFINRASVELQNGSVRRAEENDDGALLQFALPSG